MLSREHPSIRSQLLRLVAACVVPVWLVSAGLVYYAYTVKLKRVNDEILDDARATAMIVDRELSNIKGAVTALATSPSLDRRDLRAFYKQSQELLKDSPQTAIMLADASGQQLVNTYRPWGTPLPKRNNLENLNAIFKSGRPVIGNLFFGALTGQPLISVDVPVIRGGKVIYDLSMTFTVHRLLALLKTRRLPHAGYVGILDANHITMVCTNNPEENIGRPALPTLRRAIVSASLGTLERRNLEGELVLSSFCRSSLCGWTIVVGVAKSSLMPDIFGWMMWALGAATLISMAGYVVAFRVGQRIVHSIKSLVPPAVAIGRGEPVVSLPEQSVKETGEVSTALLVASNLIQHHIQKERQQQHNLQQANELLERRVRERTSELEAAVREQESFSYSVSHDLRAPLRHMNCFSALLLEEHGDVLSEEGRHYLQRIQAASQHLGVLIDNLLELSRINRAELQPERVSLSAVATAIVQMFRETDPDRVVETVIEPGLCSWGDSLLLKQLLLNLLDNAWKYTGQCGAARIEFGRLSTDSAVYFVRDNGAGFDEGYADRLFKPFERLHGSEFPGVGVGLATAQRVVLRHGGRIWAEGKEGEGATFYFTLPDRDPAGA